MCESFDGFSGHEMLHDHSTSSSASFVVDRKEASSKHLVSRAGTLLNSLNVCFGTGITTMAGSFVSCGVLLGSVLFGVMGVLNYFVSVMVLTLQHETKCEGLNRIISTVLGRLCNWFYSAAAVIVLTNVMVGYIGAGVERIGVWLSYANIDVSSGAELIICTIIYAGIVLVVLSAPQNLSFMSWLSPIVVILTLFFVFSLSYRSGLTMQSNGIAPTIELGKVGMDVISVILTYADSYSLAMDWPTVLAPLNDRLEEKKSLMKTTFAICFAMTVIPSVFGYLMFGSETNAKILTSFANDDVLMTVVRDSLFITVSLSFPVIQLCHSSIWSYNIFGEDFVWQLRGWRKFTVFIITIILPVSISAFIRESVTAIAVPNALSWCIAGFTMPSIAYVKRVKGPHLLLKRLGGVLVALFGLVAGVFSAYEAVLTAIDYYKDGI